jgi:hypothetical protein
MNTEMVQKDNSHPYPGYPNQNYTARNIQPHPGYPNQNYTATNMQPHPGYPNQNYTATNMQPHPGNPYPYPYPQPYPIVIPNDPTKEICASIGCSIFNMIFCIFLCGIPAVIFSCKANDDVNAGKTVEAQSSAKIAKILNIVGISLGSVAITAAIIYVIVLFATPAAASTSIYSYLLG